MSRGPKQKTVNLILRLPPELHEQLVAMAVDDRRSLNSQIIVHLREAAERAEARKQVRRRYTEEELQYLESQLQLLKRADAKLRERRKKTT
jgi:hypothetical protein